MEIDDFTIDNTNSKALDTAKIADHFDLFDVRARELLHVDLNDVLAGRSLPISLKESSTFQ